MLKKLSKKISHLPQTSGIYLFKDEEGTVLYVGKANNLRKRVASYFNATKDSRYLIPFLLNRARDVYYQTTLNEKEALLLENTLIKQWKPKYNIELKDDKSYSYIELHDGLGYPRLIIKKKTKSEKGIFFGPYSSGGTLVYIVNEILRIFKLRNCTDHEFQRRKTPCIYYDIDRCSAPCVGLISQEDYQQDVKEAVLFLTGKKTKLMAELRKEMHLLSEALEYEKAAKIRDKLTIMKYFIEKQIPTSIEAKLKNIFNLKNYPYHIECYDISNIGRTYRVGSRIVFKNGKTSKNDYRHYKIRSLHAASDLMMLQEVLERSIKEHKGQRSFPDLMLIDGGVTQLHIALKTIVDAGVNSVDILSISKAREKRGKLIDYLHSANMQEPYILHDKEVLYYLMRIRDEAHRFAKEYHKHLRDIKFDTSFLDSIKGIGPAKKRILLHYYKSLQDLQKANIDELKKIPGINERIAKAIADLKSRR